MSSNRSGRHLSTAVIGLFVVLSVVGTVQAADANLYVQYTTTNPGGNYSGNVNVVWLTTPSGSFVATVGSTTTDNKRALWANTQADELDEWYLNNLPVNPDRTADIAARTGATQSSYKTYTFNWNWRDTDGTTIPDGTYQLHFLVTNSNSASIRNHAIVNNVIKGPSVWSYGPTTQNGYNNISLAFTPAGLGVDAKPATDIGSSSATLNGEVTAIDSPYQPTVYIYWGDNDAGTTSGSWGHVVNLGSLGVGTFSMGVIDLTPATTYYYRCRVVTTSPAPAKDIWSGVVSFTTTQPEFAHINIVSDVIDFGKVSANDYSEKTVTIQNSGRLALSINSLEFIGMVSDSYSLVSPPALPLVIDAVSGPSWTNQDIGGVSTPGSVEYSGDLITINASGEDIWNSSDEFHFLYLPMTGDGTITARVDSVENTDHWAKAGVMMRETLTAGSKNVFMAMSYGDGATYQWRNSTNGSTSSLHDNTWAAPYWVRAVRSGNTFTGYVSPDGLNWTQWGSPQTFTMNTTLYIGLGVTSHNDGTLCTAVFSNVTTSVPPPSPDEETLTVRFNPKSVQDYKYTKLAIGSNDPDQVAYVGLRGSGGPDAALGTRQVGGIGGHAKALAKYGDKVLLGQGAMLVLLDVSNPASPSEINQIRLDGVIKAITVQGDVAYVAMGNKGFAVMDLKNFMPLKGAATFETGGFAWDIDAEGSFLCVADGIAGTHVYDISSPLEPALIANYETNGAAISVHISSDILYILDESEGIQKVQLTLASVQDTYPGLEFGTEIKNNGTLIYTIDSFGNLSVLDTAGGGITLQGETTSQVGANRDIEIQDSYAYVVGELGMGVVDISNANEPNSVAVYSNLADPSGIVVDGTIAYVADGLAGLQVLDISNPAAISSLGSYSLMSASSGVASDSLGDVYVVGNQQHLADYDLSVPMTPAVNNTYDSLFHAEDIEIEGQYAFVAAGLTGLNVFDLSNPTGTPGALATSRFASAVSVNGSTAMVCDSNDVYVVDVSSPMSPSLIGSMGVTGWASDVAVGNSYGYVAEGGMGISILDLSTAQLVSSYPVPGLAYGVEVDGTTLYVACGTAGVIVLDVSNPTNPSLITEYDLPGMIVDVAKVGDKLCVADATYGISVLDISNPGTPVLYASAATPATAFHISCAGSRILVADRNGGLAVLAVTDWPKNTIGDISDDYQVDFDDLVLIAAQWLNVESDLNVWSANLNYYDTIVNLRDLSFLSEYWQTEYNSPDLVLRLKLDETGGSVAWDSSENGHNGTLVNMDNSDWVTGKTGNALDFDGVDDYVNISLQSTANLSGFTVSYWARVDGNSGLFRAAFCSRNSNLTGYVIYASNDNKWEFWSGNGTGSWQQLEGPTVQDGIWTHIAASFEPTAGPDGNGVYTGIKRLYINGAEAIHASDSKFKMNTVQPVNIGRVADAKTFYFKGLIDDVRIYDKALTEDEIQLLSQP